MTTRRYFGHAGHLIVGAWCRFHLCTQVGGYLVSTVGEYWPERPSREIHAQVHDLPWLKANKHLKGDAFDAAYMERFGYSEVGFARKYETMVFRLTNGECDCGCGLPQVADWSELDFASAKTAKDAAEAHERLCQQYESAPVEPTP